MKLSTLKTIDQVVNERKHADPEFAAEWDRTELAREVASAVVRYRSEHKLSQRALGRLTGLHQPAIARLEAGETLPTLDTLTKLSHATGLTFRLEVVRGAVALLPPQQFVEAEYRCIIPFTVRDQHESPLDPGDLLDQQRLLTTELDKLVRCNDNVASTSVLADTSASEVTIVVTVGADSEPEAMRAALDLCRTAIHATGGWTPEWPTAYPHAAVTEFRRKKLILENV